MKMNRLRYYIAKHIIKDVIDLRGTFHVDCPRCGRVMASFSYSCPHQPSIISRIARRWKGFDGRLGDSGRSKRRFKCEEHICRGTSNQGDGCGYKMIHTIVDDCTLCDRKLQCLTYNDIVRL
jgi:hypothetical protein